MYQKSNKRDFNPLLENLYGQLFRAQMDRDWKECDRLQKLIDKLEKREGQMEQNPQDLRDYERAVR